MITRYVELLLDRKFQPKSILEIGSRDGHTSKDVINRLHKFITQNPQNDE